MNFHDDDLTPDELDGGVPSDESDDELEDDNDDSDEEGVEPVEAFLAAVREVQEKEDQKAREHAEELYGGETFDTGDISYGADLAAYDQAAYTRSKEDYSAYRYNLSSSGYASYGHSGSYDGDSWASWGGGWQSSWYSGYSTAERAIEGVHDSVATFMTFPGFTALEIVPDLGDLSEEAIAATGATAPAEVRNPYATSSDYELTLVVRIDSTLYEKLGISEAQQHYVVDGISQVLAAQTYPDPMLITLLHGFQAGGGASLPNVTREIITEMMRAQGLPLLLEQMPGWLKRVTAFRSTMFVSEPPENSTPSAFLMYAIWERDVANTLDHQDAIEVIAGIDRLLRSASDYVDEYKRPSDGAMIIDSGDRTSLFSLGLQRSEILNSIDRLLVEYVTRNCGAGEIMLRLKRMLETLQDKMRRFEIPPPPGFLSKEQDALLEECDVLRELIHDHNKTFCPDPKRPDVVRHQDFPDAPHLSLIPEIKRNRVELTRQSLFSLARIPVEACSLGPCKQETKPLERAIKRIIDLLGKFQNDSRNLLQLAEKEALERFGKGKVNGSPGRSGVSCTNHAQLRGSRRSIIGGKDREFTGQDPDFNRGVNIWDYSLANK